MPIITMSMMKMLPPMMEYPHRHLWFDAKKRRIEKVMETIDTIPRAIPMDGAAILPVRLTTGARSGRSM